MKYEYSVHIAWSKEDGAYLAAIEELPGCVADGSTPEEALSNVRVIAQEWIETAKAEKRPIPRPRTLEDCEEAQQKFQQDLQITVTNMVREIVGKLLQQEDGPLGRLSGASGIRGRYSVGLTQPRK